MNGSLSAKEKLMLISNLGTMLSSGIPILDAVDSLQEDAKGNTKKVLEILKVTLNDGKPVSQALVQMPRAFDPVTVSLIRAAEESGTLEETLKDMTRLIQRDMEFSEKIRSALTYPVFIMVVFVGVMLMILTFVVPRLGKVFSGMRVALPPQTQFMINLSNLILNYWPYMLAATIVLFVVLVMVYKSNKRAFIGALLTLPLLKTLGRNIDLARFTRSLGQMLKAGIPISDALELAEQAVRKKEILKVLKKTRENVAAGKSLSEGFREGKGIMPVMLLRTTEAAEISGTLEKTMQDLSEYFETEVDRLLRTITSLLEPIMLVVVGVLVGGMMMSVIAPIYSIMTQFGQR